MTVTLIDIVLVMISLTVCSHVAYVFRKKPWWKRSAYALVAAVFWPCVVGLLLICHAVGDKFQDYLDIGKEETGK